MPENKERLGQDSGVVIYCKTVITLRWYGVEVHNLTKKIFMLVHGQDKSETWLKRKAGIRRNMPEFNKRFLSSFKNNTQLTVL